ncbi:MAG: hypothetical protein NVS3B19_14710 [Ginsengibacter sp.]
MLRNLKFLKKLIRLFGAAKGITLFINLKTRKSSDIIIPGIKHSFQLRKATSDVATFTQVFVHKEYNINFPNDPKFIIDGGANIGLFTILMKNKYPDAIIICIEPDDDNFEILQRNVSGYKNVYCEHAGLWNREAKLSVFDKFKMGKWGMVVEENLDGNISALSIDRLIEKYQIPQIDILKLDIETSEKIVFKNNYDKWLPKTKMIVAELHDEMEQGCSKPFFEAITKTFEKFRYSFYGENTVIVNENLHDNN